MTKVNQSNTRCLLYDNEHFRNIVVIDIAAAGFRKDFEKIANDIPEGLAYNYLSGKWRKYSRENGEVFANPSFCDFIGYDLNKFVQ